MRPGAGGHRGPEARDARGGAALPLRRALAAALLALLACAGPRAAPPPRVAAEVYRGLPQQLPAWESPGLVPFHLVLDATLSMRLLADSRAAPGVRRIDAARAAAERALRALPSGRDVTAHVLGAARGGGCPGPVPVTAPAGEPPAPALASALRALRPRSEGSLGTALAAVARDLRAQGDAALRGARVVVVSDLEHGCGPEPCAAAAELAALGAAIDVVAIGDAEAPACLADPAPPEGPPPALAEALSAPPAPPLRVEQHDESGAQVATARGRADGTPLETRPGRALLVVGLEPVVWVGPLELAPGSTTRVRILDFPDAEPPVRSVWTDRSAGDATGGGDVPAPAEGGETSGRGDRGETPAAAAAPAPAPSDGAEPSEAER